MICVAPALGRFPVPAQELGCSGGAMPVPSMAGLESPFGFIPTAEGFVRDRLPRGDRA